MAVEDRARRLINLGFSVGDVFGATSLDRQLLRGYRDEASQWQSLVDQRAAAGGQVGQYWYDNNAGKFGGIDAETVGRYAAQRGYQLGDQWAPYNDSIVRTPYSISQLVKQGGYGTNISYKDAADIAFQTGSSVDRVFEVVQGKNLGTTSIGAAAGRDGYYNPNVQQKPSYAEGVAQYNQAYDRAAAEQAFMQQQQAAWAAMDEMNAAFMAQAQMMQPQPTDTPKIRSFGQQASGSADLATVKRKKKPKKVGSTQTSVSTGSGTGLSLGGVGPSNNGLSIGKQT